MDGDRFDHLARSLSTRLPRRRALGLLAGVPLGLFSPSVPAGDAARRGGCPSGKRKCGNGCIPRKQCCAQTERRCDDGRCVPDRPGGPCCRNEEFCLAKDLCVPECRTPKVLDQERCVCACPKGAVECDGKCVVRVCTPDQKFDPRTCKCTCARNEAKKCPNGHCPDQVTGCCANERPCPVNDSCIAVKPGVCCPNEVWCPPYGCVLRGTCLR